MSTHPYLPYAAEVVERIQESPTVFTLRLRFMDPKLHERYDFRPGQFNMLYLYGAGEVPISIVSDPDEEMLDHTIRSIGRITRGLAQLDAGDQIGIRGPYGRGWPLRSARGRDVVLVTGGLGCAPVVSVINYIMRRRNDYGRLVIIQGVKHSDDLIWRQHFETWAKMTDTQVLLAADVAGPGWPWHIGRVTVLLDQAHINPQTSTVMLCGPEMMMKATVSNLTARGVDERNVWVSMERNMQCAIGHCGHCQHGDKFICRDGPVFCYSELKPFFSMQGY